MVLRTFAAGQCFVFYKLKNTNFRYFHFTWQKAMALGSNDAGTFQCTHVQQNAQLWRHHVFLEKTKNRNFVKCKQIRAFSLKKSKS